jgi:hypothetical protein
MGQPPLDALKVFALLKEDGQFFEDGVWTNTDRGMACAAAPPTPPTRACPAPHVLALLSCCAGRRRLGSARTTRGQSTRATGRRPCPPTWPITGSPSAWGRPTPAFGAVPARTHAHASDTRLHTTGRTHAHTRALATHTHARLPPHTLATARARAPPSPDGPPPPSPPSLPPAEPGSSSARRPARPSLSSQLCGVWASGVVLWPHPRVSGCGSSEADGWGPG